MSRSLKLRRFEKLAINNFDGCVVTSDVDYQILRKLGNTSRLYVVPNGTDTEFFRQSRKKTSENSMLWIGHMDVHTNRDAVLYFWHDIYSRIRKRCPNVSMTFVGTSPPKEIAHAAETDGQIIVTGFVEDIRPYVQDAAVVVVPIRIGSGTRLKILDAMAMGKAIISTSVGCEGLNVTDGENILIADYPEEFANRTIGLLENKDRREKLEQNGRKLAMTYDWKPIQKIQEAVYQDVMKRRVL